MIVKVPNPLKIPGKLLSPIGKFLQEQLPRLEKRKKELEQEDPFQDRRAENHAAPDTDAAEQFGHARIEAMRKEMDRKIIQIRKALTAVKLGKYGVCEVCGEMIDTDRLMALPETTRCARHAD